MGCLCVFSLLAVLWFCCFVWLTIVLLFVGWILCLPLLGFKFVVSVVFLLFLWVLLCLHLVLICCVCLAYFVVYLI